MYISTYNLKSGRIKKYEFNLIKNVIKPLKIRIEDTKNFLLKFPDL